MRKACTDNFNSCAECDYKECECRECNGIRCGSCLDGDMYDDTEHPDYENEYKDGRYIAKLLPNKPQTNADRIRSMTDEELANLLSSAWNKADYEDGDYDPAWLGWLRKPSESEVEHDG